MKTILIFLFGFLLTTTNVYSDSREMMVIVNTATPSGWEIRWSCIKDIPAGFVHYDGILLPMTQESQYSNAQVFGTSMILGAAYNGNTNQGTDGVFGYGLYYVEVRQNNVPLGSCYIDTRDCNYGYNENGVKATADDGYSSQDFDLTFNDNSGDFIFGYRDGVIKFEKPGSGNETYNLWSVATKPRSILLFKNFKYTNNSPTNVNVTVSNNTYSVSPSSSLSLGLGSDATTVSAQNRKPVLPIFFPNLYVNFSSWENGVMFDTTRTVNTSINLSDIQATYVLNDQECTISGPGFFDKKQSLTYHSSITKHGPDSLYNHEWWIKYDFNGVWQRLGGGLENKTIIAGTGLEDNFNIKCYLRDKHWNIGVWSNELHVAYNGIQDPYEYADRDDPESMHSSSTMSDETILESAVSPAIQPWWPVDADRLTLRRKLEILLPIQETVMELTHKFRWKESDPFEAGDNSTLFAEAYRNEITMAEKESSSKMTEMNTEKADKEESKHNLSKSGLSDKNTLSVFVPKDFAIYQNYPNPFNPSTTISFDLAKPSAVKLTIFNALGQTTRNLYEGTKPQGRFGIVWDGKNDQGIQVPSGIYIYRLEAGEFIQSKKMLLVK